MPWSPADVTTKLWLDFADAGTVTTSSGKITQVNDKSGNGFNFSNSSGSSLQPGYGSTTQNGLNTASFDGGDFLADFGAASHWTFLHDGTPFLVGVVAKITSTSGGYIANMDGGGNRGWYLFKNPSAGIWQLVQAAGGVRPVENVTANGIVGTGWEVITVLGDANDATAAARSTVSVVGQTDQANNARTDSVNASAPQGLLALGALQDSGGVLNNYMTGQIAEVVILSGADATSGNAALLETYFYNKWLAAPVTATMAGAWGSWSASMAAAPVTPAAMVAAWGTWSATAAFTDSVLFTASWGGWDADGEFTVTTFSELDAEWGNWSATAAATPTTQASFDAPWGAWSASMAAAVTVFPTMAAPWGAWAANLATADSAAFDAAWGAWSAAASFVQPQRLDLATIYSRSIVHGLRVRAAGVEIPEWEFQVINPATQAVKGTIAGALEGSGWEDVWCDAGAGTLRLAYDEPTAALVAPGDVIRCFYRGDAVYQWIVDGFDKATVPGDEADRISEWGGAGRITGLNHARIAPGLGFDLSPVEDTRGFGWIAPGYDFDFFWPFAKQLTEQGTDDVWSPLNRVPADWPDPAAWWIWSAEGTVDLAPPGLVFARFKAITATAGRVRVYVACDNRGAVWWDGAKMLAVEGFSKAYTFEVDISDGEHSIAIVAENFADDGDPGGNPGGILCSVYQVNIDGTLGELWFHTDDLWKVHSSTGTPPGTTVGAINQDVFLEAQARGVLADLDWTSEFFTDSNGNPWDPIGDAAAPVGKDYWAFQQQLASADCDIAMAPGSFTFHAWRKGEGGRVRDITLRSPTDEDDPTTGNLASLRHKGTSVVANAAHIRWAGGWTYLDLSGPDAPIEIELDLGHVDDRAEAIRVATTILTPMSGVRVEHSAEVVVRDGEVPWRDYKPGDIVWVPDEHGTVTQQRAVSLAAVIEGDELRITPKLKDRILEADERREAWLKAWADGAARGDSKGLNPTFPPPPAPQPIRAYEKTWNAPGSLDSVSGGQWSFGAAVTTTRLRVNYRVEGGLMSATCVLTMFVNGVEVASFDASTDESAGTDVERTFPMMMNLSQTDVISWDVTGEGCSEVSWTIDAQGA